MEYVSTRLSGTRTLHSSFGRRIVDALLSLDARHRQHHAMRNLDNHLRKDVGLPTVDQGGWDAPQVMQRN